MIRLFLAFLRLLPKGVQSRRSEIAAVFRMRVEDARRSGGNWAASRAAFAEYWDALCAAIEYRDGADPLSLRPSQSSYLGDLSMQALRHDISFALRLALRQPAFALTIVLTLALGIGANTAVFSVLYGVMLQPLPYRDADRLATVFVAASSSDRVQFSPLDARDVETNARTLESLALINSTSENLTGGSDPVQLGGSRVSANFFSTLGAAPIAGRAFTAEEAANDAHIVVISERVWRGRFGASTQIVGQTIQLDDERYRVTGVIANDAAFPERSDFWRPLELAPNAFNANQRGARYLEAIARLKPGVSVEQTRAELSTILKNATPQRRAAATRFGAAVIGLRDAEIERARPALLALSGGVIVLLLIACSNIANLTLTHAMARTSEVAVRTSLGASRGRVVRQLLIESGVLAAAGTAVGIAVAAAIVRWLVAIAPAGLPGVDRIAINSTVLLFATALAGVTALLFGLYPAWKASGIDLASLTRSGGTRTVTGGGAARRTLAVAEVALAVMLLGAAALLVQTMSALQRVKPGFDPEQLLTFSVSLPYNSPEQRVQFFDALSPALSSLPGVSSAAIGAGVPFAGFNAASMFTLNGIATPADGAVASMRVVSGDYFKAMRIPLVAGRAFDTNDRADGQLVAVINERMAKRYFKSENPVGREIEVQASIAPGTRKGLRTIVGVVGDVRSERLEHEAGNDIYLPQSQHAVGSGVVVLRTNGDAMAMLDSVRARMRELAPSLPLADVKPMTALVGESAGEQRLTTTLLAVFAVIAAGLAAVGLYGVFSVGVTQRTKEIGIRLALGAERSSVLLLFVREGLVLAVIGSVLGLIGLRFASKLVASMLVGVAATDATTFAGAAAFLLVVAAAASYLPARRASKLNPIAVLNRN